MKTLMDCLTEKSLVSEATISASVNTGAATDLIERMLKGSNRQKFNPTLRPFALTLAFYSQKKVSYPFLCNLVMDEMSIRRQVEWTGSKSTGYVDVGTNLDSVILPEAREALVFMLVCLNGSWKVPVGYFLVNGLVATEKAE